MWTTPELAPPLLTTTPHQREDVSVLDRFNVHRCPTRRVFSGTGIELMTCLSWLDTLTTGLPQPHRQNQKLHDTRMVNFLPQPPPLKNSCVRYTGKTPVYERGDSLSNTSHSTPTWKTAGFEKRIY
ncbi:uncharacterized protein TNCV_2681921 [Trichonephila clavipes]|nr:uncharacterized protein TNCV_2681921 [Trichonephila clavipes]